MNGILLLHETWSRLHETFLSLNALETGTQKAECDHPLLGLGSISIELIKVFSEWALTFKLPSSYQAIGDGSSLPIPKVSKVFCNVFFNHQKKLMKVSVNPIAG